jgi:hypothetical protein
MIDEDDAYYFDENGIHSQRQGLRHFTRKNAITS